MAESWKCQCCGEGHATDNFDGSDVTMMIRMIMVMMLR